MPAPLECNNIWRMSNVTAPTNDIDFDAYDFQLCRPQTDIKDAFESRELEANYCRDFACCGLILTDLHDLLQHYEEWHVPLEEDSELYNDEDDFGENIVSILPFDDDSLHLQQQQQQQQQHDDDDDDNDDDPEEINQELSVLVNHEDFDINILKKKAAAYLTDLCQQQSDTSAVKPPSTDDDNNSYDDEHSCYGSIGCEDLKQEPIAKAAGKKRSFDTAMEQIAQTAVKKLALSSSPTTSLNPVSLSTVDGATPSSCLGLYLTDQEFLAHAGVLLASSAHQSNQNAGKPYKCPVQGCDKAYKNPNGLKYHNQHGHCNLTTDENENVASKPYQCALGGCGKRYKNLNGLKYHIEHSHVAALNHTLATFGSSFFQQHCLSRQLSSVSTTPSLSPSSSPELSCVSFPF